MIGEPGPVHHVGLTLDRDTNVLVAGETAALGVMAHIGTGVVDQTSAAKYHVSDSSIAAVDAHGVVTALGPGRAEIVAELDGVKSPPVAVAVTRGSEAGR